MKLGLAFAALATLSLVTGTGCNRQSQTPCQAAIGGVLDRSVSQADADDATTVREMNKRLAEQLSKLCAEDRWSAPMIECLDAADGPQAVRGCSAKLSVGQTEHLVKLMNMLTGVPAATLQHSLTGSGT